MTSGSICCGSWWWINRGEIWLVLVCGWPTDVCGKLLCNVAMNSWDWLIVKNPRKYLFTIFRATTTIGIHCSTAPVCYHGTRITIISLRLLWQKALQCVSSLKYIYLKYFMIKLNALDILHFGFLACLEADTLKWRKRKYWI